MIGYAVGQVLVWSLLLLAFRRKSSTATRIAFAFLLTSGYMVFDKKDELAFGYDERQAKSILAVSKIISPEETFSKYPNNNFFRLSLDVIAASKVTESRVAEVATHIEPAALSETLVASSPRPTLVAYRNAAQEAASNARKTITIVQNLYEEESNAVRTKVAMYAPRGAVASMMRGVAQRHERSINLAKDLFGAQSTL